MITTEHVLETKSTVVHQSSIRTRVVRIGPDGAETEYTTFVGTGEIDLPPGEYKFISNEPCKGTTIGTVEVFTGADETAPTEEPCEPGEPVGLVGNLDDLA